MEYLQAHGQTHLDLKQNHTCPGEESNSESLALEAHVLIAIFNRWTIYIIRFITQTMRVK